MSFLGGARARSNGTVDEEKIQMAITELDTVTDFFNRMVTSCYSKCIGAKYPADGDLNKGESVCIDNCVAKYTRAQKEVGDKLQSRGAAAPAASGSAFGSI